MAPELAESTSLWDETIEVGNDEDCADQASTINSYATSVTDSVFEYTYENGRRYHNYRAGKYLLPNDEDEQSRMDCVHHLWNLCLKGELATAPLPKGGPKRALDLGTGTGIWAIEFGDLYPNAEVIGTELSPIQPLWVPPNVKFEIDDFEDPWAYAKETFDYIHIRCLVGAVKDWDELFRRCYEHLTPGGFLEVQECDMSTILSDDNTLSKDNALKVYMETLSKAGGLIGRRMDIAQDLGNHITKAGFLDVQKRNVKVPLGPWAKNKTLKEMGMWEREIVSQGTEAYGLALFTRVLGMSEKEAKEMCKRASEECHNSKTHAYGYWIAYHGRKPAKGGDTK